MIAIMHYRKNKLLILQFRLLTFAFSLFLFVYLTKVIILIKLIKIKSGRKIGRRGEVEADEWCWCTGSVRNNVNEWECAVFIEYDNVEAAKQADVARI